MMGHLLTLRAVVVLWLCRVEDAFDKGTFAPQKWRMWYLAKDGCTIDLKIGN